MKAAWNSLFFGIAVQVFAIMLAAGLGVSPFLVSKDINMKDPGEIVDSWEWGGQGSMTGDIMSGLRFFWDINVPLIESMFILAKNMGCPLIFTDPMKLLWRMIWITFVIECIFGRRIFD